MGTYASDTSVTPEASRAEIERTLQRFGAKSFMYGWDDDTNQAAIGFVANGRQIRFLVAYPDKTDRRFTHTPSRGNRRTAEAAEVEWRQAIKARWRALNLVIKAKLAAVEEGITTFESEFAMNTVLPDGRTAAEHVLPAIQTAYDTGQVQPMLALGTREDA